MQGPQSVLGHLPLEKEMDLFHFSLSGKKLVPQHVKFTVNMSFHFFYTFPVLNCKFPLEFIEYQGATYKDDTDQSLANCGQGKSCPND